MARSALTGTSTRAAERSGGFGATAHAAGIAATAIAATTDLTTARRGCLQEVRARNRCCMRVHVATCTAGGAAGCHRRYFPPQQGTLTCIDFPHVNNSDISADTK